MKLFGFSTTACLNLGLVFLSALCLCACVVSQQGKMVLHNLSVAQGKDVSVSLQLPSKWKVKENPNKQILTLQTREMKEQATITAKKLEAETVSIKLLKIFGRIDIKEMTKSGWTEESCDDDIHLHGDTAVQYFLRKGEDAANVYFIAKGKYAYIVTITAPFTTIATATDEIIKGVFIGQIDAFDASSVQNGQKSMGQKAERDMAPSKETPRQAEPYLPSADVLDLVIAKFDATRKACLDDSFKALTTNDKVRLVEQVCVRYALYKTEALFSTVDKDIAKIFSEVDRLLLENPKHQGLLRCKALIAFLDNLPEQATMELENLLKQNPGDIHAKLYLVMIYPYDTAFIDKTIEESTKLRPVSKLAVYVQARHLLAQGKKREAFDLLKETARKDRESTWISYAVARNEQSEGNLLEAKQLYGDILKTCPTFNPARYSLALIDYKEKNYQGAQKNLDPILSVQPEDPEVILLQGLVLKGQKMNEKAKAAFENVLAIEPDNYRALYNIGALCAVELKDPICARQAFVRYVAVAPEDNRYDSIISWLNKN